MNHVQMMQFSSHGNVPVIVLQQSESTAHVAVPMVAWASLMLKQPCFQLVMSWTKKFANFWSL